MRYFPGMISFWLHKRDMRESILVEGRSRGLPANVTGIMQVFGPGIKKMHQ